MGLCVLLPVLGIACHRLEPDIHIRRTDTATRPGGGRTPRRADSAAPVPLPREGLFVTAVDYPAGYDWRRDTAHGSITGRVLLLRQHEGLAAFDTLLALEAGAGKAVSLDPDRHHFAGGHLYTDCLTEIGTVYRRDGRTVFLSPEREYVRGILSLGEDLFVLSQRLEAGGFVLRRNWKPLLIRESGILRGSLGDPAFGRCGALFEDLGQACFFYEDGDGRWSLVRGGREERITLPDHLDRLFDIRSIGGVVCLLCQRHLHEPVLYIGSKKYDLSASSNIPSVRIGFHLLRPGSFGETASTSGTAGELRFSGTFRMNWNQVLYTGLWSTSRFLQYREGHIDWLEDGIFLYRKDGRIISAGIGGVEYDLQGPAGGSNGHLPGRAGSLLLPQCAWTDGSVLWLALTRYDGTPFLWSNKPLTRTGNPPAASGGDFLPLGINGCLSSVTVLGDDASG